MPITGLLENLMVVLIASSLRQGKFAVMDTCTHKLISDRFEIGIYGTRFHLGLSVNKPRWLHHFWLA